MKGLEAKQEAMRRRQYRAERRTLGRPRPAMAPPTAKRARRPTEYRLCRCGAEFITSNPRCFWCPTCEAIRLQNLATRRSTVTKNLVTKTKTYNP